MSVVDVALSPFLAESSYFHGSCNNNGHQGPNQEGSSSILIYLSLASSLIPMRVLESESIASLKLRIQKSNEFVVKKQKLVFGGRELTRSNSLVKDYCVASGNVIHLVLKLSDLLLITVRTTCGQEFEFRVDRFRKVAFLKQRIFNEGKGFVDVEEHEIFYNGEKLDDQKVIGDLGNNSDAAIHLLVQKTAQLKTKQLLEQDVEISVVAENSNERRDCEIFQDLGIEQPGRNFWLEPIIVNPKCRLSSTSWSMINATFDGLEKGKPPIRSTEGTGGTYFMQDPSGQKFVSVFKPIDEEPLAANNPRRLPVSLTGEGLKKGTKVGRGAVREVAAFLLDHPKNGPRLVTGEVVGFSGVPHTILAHCMHEVFYYPDGYEYSMKNVKIGSLQMYIKNEGSCDEVGPGIFPVQEVHNISVLDIRLANADRHGGNILISKGEDGKMKLVPIDHGYCLPEEFEDCTFDWLYWPQAKQPYSQETIEYINSLDAEKDIELLKYYGWEMPFLAARVFRISTMLLKKGAKRGLTPFAIGSIMCRESLNKESVIETIVHEAEDSMVPGMSESVFLETVSQLLDARLDKLTQT